MPRVSPHRHLAAPQQFSVSNVYDPFRQRFPPPAGARPRTASVLHPGADLRPVWTSFETDRTRWRNRSTSFRARQYGDRAPFSPPNRVRFVFRAGGAHADRTRLPADPQRIGPATFRARVRVFTAAQRFANRRVSRTNAFNTRRVGRRFQLKPAVWFSSGETGLRFRYRETIAHAISGRASDTTLAKPFRGRPGRRACRERRPFEKSFFKLKKAVRAAAYNARAMRVMATFHETPRVYIGVLRAAADRCQA